MVLSTERFSRAAFQEKHPDKSRTLKTQFTEVSFVQKQKIRARDVRER